MYNAGVDNPIMPGQPPTGYPPQPAQAGYPPPQPAQAGYPPPQASGYPPPQQAGYPAPQPAFHTNQTSNTTVVIQQPQIQMVVKGREAWSTGLCSCFEDVNLCLIGLLCPGVLPCVVSCKAGECCCVGAMFPIALRASIRERYNIKGDIAGDCCTLYFCPLCAFCQMGREVDIRAG